MRAAMGRYGGFAAYSTGGCDEAAYLTGGWCSGAQRIWIRRFAAYSTSGGCCFAADAIGGCVGLWV
jgi:hypothetical protein